MTEPSPDVVARLHRAAATVADRMGGRHAPWRRRVSPWFSVLLQALSGGRGVLVGLNGERFRVDARYRVFLQPDYEAPVASYLRQRVRPGDCCLDVGAHIGAYALQLARWCSPGGRVIAFEPNPATAAVLRRHVRMNDFDSTIVVEPSALGKSEGSAVLFGDATSGLSRLGVPNPDAPAPSRPSLTVPLLTVDSYCGAHRVEPDWMLVDVEGYEFDVLAGARRTIDRCGAPLAIVLEVHPALWPLTGWSRQSAAALLASIGRRAVPLVGQADPLSEHGIVALERA